MKCPACQGEVQQDAAFCQHCGARLESAAPAAAPRDQIASAASVSLERDGDQERDLWEGGYSPKAMIGTWIVCGLVSVGLIVAGVFIGRRDAWIAIALAIPLIWLYELGLFGYRRLGVQYRLTSKRFFHQSGLIRRVTDRIEVIDINDVSYVQGVADRFTGVGTITLLSNDTSHETLPMRGIDDVERVAKLIDDARLAERRRRGLHMIGINPH